MKTTNKTTIIFASLLLGACINSTSTNARSNTLFAAITQTFSTSYGFVIRNNTILIDGRYLIPFNIFGDIKALDVRQKRDPIFGLTLDVRDGGPNGTLLGKILLDNTEDKTLVYINTDKPNFWKHTGKYYVDQKDTNVTVVVEENGDWFFEDGTRLSDAYTVTIEKKRVKIISA